jgi:heme/copper-type cytochrome/quinol oxidase subunit 1
MPRRYIDYPDGYTFWNQLSRIGRLISIVGVVYFFFILWESISRNRLFLFCPHPKSHNEWLHNYFPSDYHNNNDLVIIW